MKSFCYDIDRACFVDPSGEKLSRYVPELFYQERAEWRIALRGGENAPVDLSGIVAWGAAVAAGFDADAAPMCRTLSEGIAADAATGIVTVTLDAATAEFLAAVDGVSRKKAFFELYGLNASGERAIHLEFDIAARMILDPDPEDRPEVPETLATKNYVTARIGSAVESAYAAASGAIVSGAEFSTTVGGYTVALTSGGGLVVSGGGVALQVSSGGIVASGASGESVVLSGGNANLTTDLGGVVVSGENVVISGAGGDLTVNGMTNLWMNGEAICVNERPVLTELVTATDSETTSASIDVLAGGTSYIFTQPLTSLSVASIASSMQESWLEFTVASGGSVSINDSGYRWLGGRPSAFEGGSSYAVGVMGGMIVCNVLEE